MAWRLAVRSVEGMNESELRQRALTAGLVAMISLVALEYLAVAIAMPVVARELGGLELYGLAFSGAMAAGVVGTVLGGRWADRRGPQPPLWTGTALFSCGLVIAGVASSMEMLIGGRLVQGFGGALISVALYVVVARAYPEKAHPRIFSLFATAWVVPSMVGPALVGGVTETVGWRWVFLGVPLLMVPAALALRHGFAGLPLAGGQSDAPAALLGKIGWATLAATGAGLVQYGSGGRTLVLVAGLVVLAVTLPRLLPVGTLRAARGLPTVVALRGLATGAFFAVELLVPLMLVSERGLSPLLAGLALTGGALTWAFGSWLQGREVFSRMLNLRGGMALIALGFVLMGSVAFAAVPVAMAYPSWIVAGLGMGLVYPTQAVLTLELSRPGEQGANSSALQVGEMVFSVVAIAVTGALFNAVGSGYWAAFAAAVVLALIGVGIAPRFAQPSRRTAPPRIGGPTGTPTPARVAA